MAEQYDLDRAHRVLTEHTETLRRELKHRGILATDSLADVAQRGLQRGYSPSSASGTIRVKPAWNPEEENGVVIVDIEISTTSGAVILSANAETGNALAIAFDEAGVDTVLESESDDVTEVTPNSLEIECGDVCDDCCGALDCTAEVEITLLSNGSPVQSGCGCLEGGGLPSPYCCEDDSCAGFFPCSC